MRPQTLKTPFLQFKSKNQTDSAAEPDGTKSAQKAAATTPESGGPPPLSSTRTDAVGPTRSGGAAEEAGGCCGRERLKRHWVEVAGRVWIPDFWGQEDLLKDWIDCSAFDSTLVGSSIMSARESLVEEATSTRFGIENSC